MTSSVDRRTFLRAAGALTAGVGLAGLGRHSDAAAAVAKGAPHAEKLGWQLGCQAWTFNNFTFYEAVDKTASLGLHYIEAFPNQKISKTGPEARMGESLSQEQRREVKKYLADKGVRLVSFGVTGASKGTFEFAKDMGIKTIVSEPPYDAFDKLDQLCQEYEINLALHDHPRPAPYWNPDTVLKVCEGHSKRIGACADIGHWMRSDINPLDALKKLQGRLIEFHFKDLNKYGPDAHDVPWGTGKADVKAILTEVHRQGFKGLFAIEYEYHFGHSLPEVAECVAYFDRVCAELAQG